LALQVPLVLLDYPVPLAVQAPQDQPVQQGSLAQLVLQDQLVQQDKLAQLVLQDQPVQLGIWD
jgi:hypothetical protein